MFEAVKCVCSQRWQIVFYVLDEDFNSHFTSGPSAPNSNSASEYNQSERYSFISGMKYTRRIRV